MNDYDDHISYYTIDRAIKMVNEIPVLSQFTPSSVKPDEWYMSLFSPTELRSFSEGECPCCPLPPDLLYICLTYMIHEERVYHFRRYKRGRLWRQGFTVGGIRHGVWNWWHNNGQLGKQGTYVNGKKHGEWKEWSCEGRMLAEESYLNGVEHGEFKRLSENGTVHFQGCYVNGQKHGKWIEQYRSVTYVNGEEKCKKFEDFPCFCVIT